MIRLGIVGTNYGRNVLLPAFRADPRCQVVALAGSDAGRTAELAVELILSALGTRANTYAQYQQSAFEHEPASF